MTEESKEPLDPTLIKHLTPPGVVKGFQDEYAAASGGAVVDKAPDETPLSGLEALTHYNNLLTGGVELDPAADIEEDEIDHDCTDEPVCPYCGAKHDEDIWDMSDSIYEDGVESRVYCQECDKEFASYCAASYSFTTFKVDPEKDAREKAKREAESARVIGEARRDHERREAAAAAWEPGTPVRVVGKHLRDAGRVGLVASRPIGGAHARVYVAFYKGGRLPPSWRMRYRVFASRWVELSSLGPDQIEAVAWDATDEEKSDA